MIRPKRNHLIVVSFRDHEGEHKLSRQPDATSGRLCCFTLHDDPEGMLLSALKVEDPEQRKLAINAWCAFEGARREGVYPPRDGSKRSAIQVRHHVAQGECVIDSQTQVRVNMFLMTMTDYVMSQEQVENAVEGALVFAGENGAVTAPELPRHLRGAVR